MSLLTKSAAKRQFAPVGSGLVPVSSRGGNVLAAMISAPAQTSATYMVAHVATDDITSLRFDYANFYYSSDGVYHEGANQISVKLGVVMPGDTSVGVRGFTASGLNTAIIDPGGRGSLHVPAKIDKGQLFYEVVYVSGTLWPVGMKVNYARNGTIISGITNNIDTTGYGFTGDSLEGSNVTSGGADLTAPGSALVPTNFVQAFSAYAVMGTVRSTRHAVVGYSGDSIITQNNDLEGMGFLWRALGVGVNRIRLSHGGNAMFNEVSPAKRNWKTDYFRYVTHFFSNFGRNDLGSRTTAQMQADYVTDWTLKAAQGALGCQGTLIPDTTSSNNWIDLAGQTVKAYEATRIAINTWLRDGAPMHLTGSTWTFDVTGTTGASIARCAVYDKTGALVTAASGPAHLLKIGVVEIADVAESARNSGKWDVSTVRTVADLTTNVGTSAYLANSATATFTAADQGKTVVTSGTGTAGATQTFNTMQVVTASQIKFYSQMITSVSGATMSIGIPTIDGVHPNPDVHRRIAASGALQPFLNTLY